MILLSIVVLCTLYFPNSLAMDNNCSNACTALKSQGFTCQQQSAICGAFHQTKPANKTFNITALTTLDQADHYIAGGNKGIAINITWSTVNVTSQSLVVGYKLIVEAVKPASSRNISYYYCVGYSTKTSGTLSQCVGAVDNVNINPGDEFKVILEVLVNVDATYGVVQRLERTVNIPNCLPPTPFYALPQCQANITNVLYHCCNRTIIVEYSWPVGYAQNGVILVRSATTGNGISRSKVTGSPAQVTVPNVNENYNLSLSNDAYGSSRVRIHATFPNCSFSTLTAEVQSCSNRTYVLKYEFPVASKVTFELIPYSAFAYHRRPVQYLVWNASSRAETRYMQIPEGYRKNYKRHTVTLLGHGCTYNKTIGTSVEIDFSKCCQCNVKPCVLLLLFVAIGQLMTAMWG